VQFWYKFSREDSEWFIAMSCVLLVRGLAISAQCFVWENCCKLLKNVSDDVLTSIMLLVEKPSRFSNMVTKRFLFLKVTGIHLCI